MNTLAPEATTDEPASPLGIRFVPNHARTRGIRRRSPINSGVPRGSQRCRGRRSFFVPGKLDFMELPALWTPSAPPAGTAPFATAAGAQGEGLAPDASSTSSTSAFEDAARSDITEPEIRQGDSG
jgi:hypothetical protein